MYTPALAPGVGWVVFFLTRYHVWRRWSAAFWRSWRALMHARLPCIGAATSDVLRSRAPAPDEEPIAWAEGRGAAFPQEHAGVDRGGAARDRA